MSQVYVGVNAHLCFAQLHFLISLLRSGGFFLNVTYSDRYRSDRSDVRDTDTPHSPHITVGRAAIVKAMYCELYALITDRVR